MLIIAYICVLCVCRLVGKYLMPFFNAYRTANIDTDTDKTTTVMMLFLLLNILPIYFLCVELRCHSFLTIAIAVAACCRCKYWRYLLWFSFAKFFPLSLSHSRSRNSVVLFLSFFSFIIFHKVKFPASFACQHDGFGMSAYSTVVYVCQRACECECANAYEHTMFSMGFSSELLLNCKM